MEDEDVFAKARKMRAAGYAVCIFTPEELGGASPDHVEDMLVEHGWDVIEMSKEENND